MQNYNSNVNSENISNNANHQSKQISNSVENSHNNDSVKNSHSNDSAENNLANDGVESRRSLIHLSNVSTNPMDNLHLQRRKPDPADWPRIQAIKDDITESKPSTKYIELTILLSVDHSSRCKLNVYKVSHTKEKPSKTNWYLSQNWQESESQESEQKLS